VIEPMRKRDLRQVFPIEAQAYPKSWSRSVFESELAQVRDGSRYYVVARSGRDVVGYAGLWFVPDPDGRPGARDQHRRRPTGTVDAGSPAG
jgi:[ribosomal protein S18]-alanine N-acetyltransferase